jgi:hypothetical protein
LTQSNQIQHPNVPVQAVLPFRCWKDGENKKELTVINGRRLLKKVLNVIVGLMGVGVGVKAAVVKARVA